MTLLISALFSRRCWILGSLLTLTACQPNTGGAPISDNGEKVAPLKIGTLLPITGDLAQYGSPMQDSVALLVEKVNGCGGVLRQPVAIVTEDSQTDPARAAAAMTKLAEVDRVSGVVGAAASAVSSVAIDVAVQNQLVQISPASTSPRFTQRSKTGEFQGFWFRTAPSDALQGPAMAKVAWDKGIKSIAIVAINNDYGNGWVDSFIPAFQALGGTVSNQGTAIFYPPDGASFEGEVTQAFAERPQAVLLIAYPETGSLVLKAAYEKGLLTPETQILLTEGMKTDAIADRVGKDKNGRFLLDGALGTAVKSGGLGLRSFTELYQEAYNRSPEIFDPHTWDAAALIVLAAEAAQSTQSKDFKAQIQDIANAPGDEVSDVCQALTLLREGRTIDYQGASGNLELDQWGDVSGEYEVWQIQTDGSLTVVDSLSVN